MKNRSIKSRGDQKIAQTIALKRGMKVRINASAHIHANQIGRVIELIESMHGPSIVRVAFARGHRDMIIRYTRDQISDIKIGWEGNTLLKEQQRLAEERLRQCVTAGDLSTLVDIHG